MLSLVVAAGFRVAAWALAVSVVAGLGAVAEAQTVRVTHGNDEVVAEGDFEALPESVEALGNPEQSAAREDEGISDEARIGLEIGAAVGTTGLLATGAYFFAQAQEESCVPEGCEVDPMFLAIALGTAVATALVPLAVLATGNATGLEGNYADTILGYVSGLVVAVLFSSLGSGPGGDAFLYPALVMGSVFPVAGAILAYEASTMPEIGARRTTGQLRF
jgi:hypothetical protein